MSFPRDPWVVAEERYLDGLNDEDKALYESASAENLLYSTSAAQILHKKNSISRDVAMKLQPLIAAISQYGNALDVISNTAPLFFSPIWGGLRVLLHIAREFDSYYVRLIDMLERIGDVIPRFKSYERLFPKHEQLLYSLSAAYLDIITFCVDAKAIFQKAKKKKPRIRIPIIRSGTRALKVAWKPFEESFGVVINNFRRHTEKVEMEAQLAHMIEEAAERREQGYERDAQALERIISEAERRRQLLLRQEQLRDNLLKRLSRCDQDYKHRVIKKPRVEGTSQWMLSSPEFNSWLEAVGSSFLWCYGIPGSGKSIVTSVVIDAIKEEQTRDGASLAWFYCDYMETETLDPLEIVGSIIKQLLPAHLLTMSIDLQLRLEQIYDNGRVPDIEELFDMLSRVISQLPKVFIVIDGLDECKERERGSLLRWLGALSNSSTTPVKLFIASREEVDIKEAIGNSLSIRTAGPQVSLDIATVVQNLVQTGVAGKRSWSQDPILLQEIVDALIAGAKGMFLWVILQLHDICEELSEDGVRDALSRLPDGLNATFIRALQKIKMRGPTQVAAARTLFMWLVGSRRALTIDELKEAVSIVPGDADLYRGKMPDDAQLIRACGNLVTYDSEEGTIKLAHYTVQQFLLSQPSELEETLKVPNFHLQLDPANIQIGQICMTYLCFSAFETQIVPRTLGGLSASDNMLLRSPVSGWVPQMIGFSQAQTTVWNIFKGNIFSSTSPTLDIDFSRHLYYLKKSSRDFTHQYKFLGYVIEFWVQHAASFTPEQTEIWKQFGNLALERRLFFDFQPWLAGNFTKSSHTLCAFRWALENTHEPLLRLTLSSSEYDWSFLSCALRNNEHAVCFASRMGYEQIVKILLPAFSSSFSNDTKKNTEVLVRSVKLAISNRHASIVIALLRNFEDLEELLPGGPLDEVFRTALRGGHGQIPELLRSSFGFGSLNNGVIEEPKSDIYGINLLSWGGAYENLGPPEAADQPAGVDIIAVHGLYGNPWATWADRSSGTNWLRDFLPDLVGLSNSRIMTFGYKSHLMFSESGLGIQESAINLLKLVDKWQQGASGPRRTVFICHDFGGLVVKKALILAHIRGGEFRFFRNCCHGIVFLGTPHRELKSMGASEVYKTTAIDIARSLKPPRAREPLEEDIQNASGTLRLISEQFLRCSQDLEIVSVYREQTRDIRLPSLADTVSAILNIRQETILFTDADHRAMCRFTSNRSSRFLDLKREVLKMVKSASERPRPTRDNVVPPVNLWLGSPTDLGVSILPNHSTRGSQGIRRASRSAIAQN